MVASKVIRTLMIGRNHGLCLPQRTEEKGKRHAGEKIVVLGIGGLDGYKGSGLGILCSSYADHVDVWSGRFGETTCGGATWWRRFGKGGLRWPLLGTNFSVSQP